MSKQDYEECSRVTEARVDAWRILEAAQEYLSTIRKAQELAPESDRDTLEELELSARSAKYEADSAYRRACCAYDRVYATVKAA